MPLTSEQKRRRKVTHDLKKMPLNSIEDYEAYNKQARACSVPVKPAPADMHTHVKVKFLRRDNMTHPVPLYFRNHIIDFRKTVEHGKVYDLPKIVVRQYQELGIPKYKQYVNKSTGDSETVFSHKDPRFAFQIVLDD